MTETKKAEVSRGLTIRNSTAEFLIVTGQAGGESIEVRFEGQTIWLTQKLMAELFAVDVRTVSEHLKNVFASGELSEEAVVRKFRITAADGKSYAAQHYNLDAVISTWDKAPTGRIVQSDVSVAKNYLTTEELRLWAASSTATSTWPKTALNGAFR